jgi:hypothetical protein
LIDIKIKYKPTRDNKISGIAGPAINETGIRDIIKEITLKSKLECLLLIKLNKLI